jgi:hut operon positive regulatory protein
MEFSLDRLGKVAVLAALTDGQEEAVIKSEVGPAGYRLAITFVSGMSTDIKTSFVKSIIGCAVQNGIIQKTPGQIHAVVHAALDAFTGVLHAVPADASLKLKVAIVSNETWIAVAIYGDSAFYPLTNHERCALGVMHLTG